MTLYVDPAAWWFRDRRWCHLVSDLHLDELHEFVSGLGVSRRAFHLDHYDLPDEYRSMAVDLGAQEVTSRQIVSILRTSGLRVVPRVRRGDVQAATAMLATNDTTATAIGTA
ncbi:MAG: DUF4031 domain-containing protein [Actinobacteria bacterium]|nr:DUF4031 domain-containing protein [Actinomycetota bacterium]